VRPRSRSSGQSTVEYVVVVALVLAVLLAAGAAWADGAPIAGAVSRQMAYALCLVTRGDCDEDRRPCTVASTDTTDEAGVTLFFIGIKGRRGVLVERRSDGTYAVTLSEGAGAGIDTGWGGEAKASFRGKSITLGGEARAAALAELGHGWTWVVPDEGAASAIVAEIRRNPLHVGSPPPGLGRPTVTYGEHGLSVSAGGSLGPLSAAVDASDTFGTRTDASTGRRTYYVRRRNGVTGSVLFGEDRGGASGSVRGSEEYAVTLSADGRPLDLAILGSGRYSGSLDLPDQAQEIAGMLGLPTKGDRLYSTEMHLDLTDAGNLALATDFIAQVEHPGLRVGSAVDETAQLRERLRESGTQETRTYTMDAQRDEIGGHLAAEFKIGAELSHTVEHTRLQAAMSRGLDGVWRKRSDCLAAAGRS
jgi:hypothetical protein